MQKKLILSVVIALIAAGGLVISAQGKYVRKQLQPDFFIPVKDQFNQPEKLPPLPENKVIKESQSKTISTETEVSEAEVEQPDYQDKFDEYNEDMEYLSTNGELPENDSLKKDLAVMNSNEIKTVQPKEAEPSEVSKKFEQTVDDVVAGD